MQNLIRRLTAMLFRIIFRNSPAQMPLERNSTKKILILRYDLLGDMAVTTPLICYLKHQIPKAEIHIVGSQRNIGLLRCNTDISRIYCYEFSLLSFLRIAKKCRKENYDAVFSIVFHKTTKSGIWANFCGGRKAIKITNLNYSREKLYSSMFNAMIPLTHGKYTMAELLVQMAAAAYGLKYTAEDIQFSLPYDKINANKANNFLENIEPEYRIFINISTSRPENCWPVENWISLLDLLHTYFPNLQFILGGIKNDNGNLLLITNRHGEYCRIVSQTTDILDICAVIDRCRLVISPDTGIVHIATGLKKPVLGLYTPLHKGTEFLPIYRPYEVVFSDEYMPVSALMPSKVADAFCRLWNEVNS